MEQMIMEKNKSDDTYDIVRPHDLLNSFNMLRFFKKLGIEIAKTQLYLYKEGKFFREPKTKNPDTNLDKILKPSFSRIATVSGGCSSTTRKKGLNLGIFPFIDNILFLC